MRWSNWEHYYQGDDVNDPKFNESAYVFYDFEDEEVEQMERDRIAAIKKPAPKPAPRPAPRSAPKPAPAPAPAPKPAPPVVHSPEIKQAKERVNKYQSDIKEGKVSEEIYGNGAEEKAPEPKDYSKDTYINRSSSKQPQIYDFSQSSFSN